MDRPVVPPGPPPATGTVVLAAGTAFAAALCSGPGTRAIASLGLSVGHDTLGALVVSLVVAVTGLVPLLVVAPVRRRDILPLLALLRQIHDHSLRPTSWFLWIAGVLGGVFTGVAAVVLPSLGLTLFAVAVVGGRTTAALIVDHVGLAHGAARTITTRRILAVAVVVAAMTIPAVVHPSGAGIPLAAALVATAAGASLAVQSAAGSHLRERTTPIAATIWIYLVTIAFLAVLVVPWALATHRSFDLPGAWWPYLAGPLGLVTLLVPIALVRCVGVLVVTTATVSGQLVSSLVMDAIWPVGNHTLQGAQILAAGLTVGAVVMSAASTRRRPPVPASGCA